MTINDKKLQELIGFTPHQAQKEILKSESRDIAICAGRGFGKSIFAAYRAMKTLLADDKKIAIIAPTYDLAQKPFNYLNLWIAKSFRNMLAGLSSRIPQQIITPWNSQLYCKSADNPTSILGERYDLVIVDEAARIKRNVFNTYIFPTTSKGGKSLFISTPFGKGWFYEKYQDCKPGAFYFTSKDNPYTSIDEWERAKQKLPEQVFKQEYMALFADDAASVFRGVREIISDDCLEDVTDHRYLLGVDLGKHEDFTVLIVLDKYSHKVVYFDRFKKIHWPLQKERIMSIAKRYNNARIIIDSTGLGDPISDDLKHKGLLVDDFKISGKSKQQLIDKLSIYIQQKAIIIPNNDILKDELESYGYQISDSGNIKYSAPQGLHDDCVIALALAVWGLMSPKVKNPNKLIKPRSIIKKKFQYF